MIEHKISDVTDLATKDALNTKTAEIEDKIPNTTGFTTTLPHNRLAKISFDARMKEAEKNIATKVQVTDAIDLIIQNLKK